MIMEIGLENMVRSEKILQNRSTGTVILRYYNERKDFVATRVKTLWLFYSRINAPRVLDASSAVPLELPRSDNEKRVDLLQIVEYVE